MINQRKLFRLTLLSTVVALSTACKPAPSEKKATAEVAAPLEIQATPANATRYGFSAEGSKIEFVGAKVTGTHSGSFGAFSGTVSGDGTAIDKGRVTVEIDMASLVADNPKLTGHLKSPDLFDVQKFPKSKFVSSSVVAGGENGATHTVTGNLELHGVTKSIKFPATISVSGDTVSVDADFGINRQEFGVVYPGMPDDLIKDEIRIKLQIRAKKS